MGLRDVIKSIGTDKEVQGAQSMLPDIEDGVCGLLTDDETWVRDDTGELVKVEVADDDAETGQ